MHRSESLAAYHFWCVYFIYETFDDKNHLAFEWLAKEIYVNQWSNNVDGAVC